MELYRLIILLSFSFIIFTESPDQAGEKFSDASMYQTLAAAVKKFMKCSRSLQLNY